MNYNGPLEIDHKDRNPKNFCKSNLREATRSQQMANSKPQGLRQFKGVIYRPDRHQQYQARIKKDGKFYHLGTFKLEVEAARAYDKKALELFGEFAHLNFPQEILK